jgi:hypothetical protein
MKIFLRYIFLKYTQEDKGGDHARAKESRHVSGKS